MPNRRTQYHPVTPRSLEESVRSGRATREIPNCLAIVLPGNPSDRCNRRISVQSSTVTTLFIVEEWLTLQPQHVAQSSTAVDTPYTAGATVPQRDLGL